MHKEGLKKHQKLFNAWIEGAEIERWDESKDEWVHEKQPQFNKDEKYKLKFKNRLEPEEGGLYRLCNVSNPIAATGEYEEGEFALKGEWQCIAYRKSVRLSNGMIYGRNIFYSRDCDVYLIFDSHFSGYVLERIGTYK